MSWYETTKIGGIVCDKGKQNGTLPDNLAINEKRVTRILQNLFLIIGVTIFFVIYIENKIIPVIVVEHKCERLGPEVFIIEVLGK